MRRVLVGAAALLVLLAGCTGDDEATIGGAQPSNVEVDTPALRELKAEVGVEDCVPGSGTDAELPDLTLACLGGGPDVDLAALQGPLILNFWYANCGPCREEMPVLQQFHEQYGDQVQLIGVTNDRYPEQSFELARTTGATYPQLADPGNEVQATDLRPKGYPTFAFLSADGEVTMEPGGIDSLDELVDLVEQDLGITL